MEDLFADSPDSMLGKNCSVVCSLVIVISLMLIVSATPSCETSTQQEMVNPKKIVHATSGAAAQSLDPHFVYETEGAAIIRNIYESLVRWPYGVVDGEKKDLSYSTNPDDLKPMLATNWYVSADGKEYTFEIREEVDFHNGGDLTAKDVEYSFERAMLMDRDGGPSWMILQPLTGYGSLKELASAALGKEVEDLTSLSAAEQTQIYSQYIDPAVEATNGTVTFNLPKAHSPFLSILSHGSTIGSVLDKQWCIQIGCWDGSSGSWADWWNPKATGTALYSTTNGTGPFKLNTWEHGSQVVLDRFDGYWREKASMEQVVIKKISELSKRINLFKEGKADIITAPFQSLGKIEGSPGAVVHTGLPSISMNPAGFFVSPVEIDNNEYIQDGPWNGNSIPSDLFSSLKVRKAFCLAFDYTAFNNQAYGGSGYKTHGPIPKALSWAYNSDLSLTRSQNLSKAEQLLKEARGGDLWSKGFTLPLFYNTGNYNRKLVAENLENNIEALNDSFQIEVHALDWNSYLSYMITNKVPFFVIGWFADFADPHNFANPFVSSNGTFPSWQGEDMINIFQSHFDPLVEQGITSTAESERKDAYYSISELSHDYATHIWLPQASGIRVVRDWVRGLPYNPVAAGFYFYPTKKVRTSSLRVNWNLFSPPGIPVNSDPATSLEDDIEDLTLFYDYTPGEGYTTYPDTDTQLSWEEGYWVHVNEEISVDMDTDDPTGEQTIEFTNTGWNMIGMPYNVDWSQASFSDPADFETDGAGHVRIVSWSPSDETYYNHYSSDSHVLSNWGGFWVKVKSAPANITVSKTSSSASSLDEQSPLPQSVNPAELDYPPKPPTYNETDTGLQVLASPNPVSSTQEVVLRLIGSTTGVEKIRTTVFDANGSSVWRGKAQGTTLSWDTKETPNGIYLYKSAVKVDGQWQKLGVAKLLVLK